MSRHHHITVLAAAWWLTQDERYAETAAHQLRSWWSANPFLTGVHWTSGIEAGIRLISWIWTRRLLDDWPKVGDLFEHNDDAVRQIAWHQEFLAAFPSRGSSANNHVVAEAAGRLVAACAFPWYARTSRVAAERSRPAGARARRQHLRRRSEPGAGDRLPPLRARARAAGRCRGRRPRSRPVGGDVAAPGADARCRSRHPGCHRPAPAAGRRRRRARARGRRPGARSLGHGPGHGRRPVGRVGLVADVRRRRPGLPRSVPSAVPVACHDHRSGHAGSPTPAWSSCAPAPRTVRRSGAGATAARTASCPSRRTPTPMPCPWRCGTTVSTSSPTPAPTATTASRCGGSGSARRRPTTPSRSAA